MDYEIEDLNEDPDYENTQWEIEFRLSPCPVTQECVRTVKYEWIQTQSFTNWNNIDETRRYMWRNPDIWIRNPVETLSETRMNTYYGQTEWYKYTTSNQNVVPLPMPNCRNIYEYMTHMTTQVYECTQMIFEAVATRLIPMNTNLWHPVRTDEYRLSGTCLWCISKMTICR